MSHKNLKNLLGMKFGKLTVIAFSGFKGDHAAWKCLCECGNEKRIAGRHLKGGTSSCGCLAKESARKLLIKMTYKHGLSRHKIHGVWSAMIARCTNIKDINYHNYGGRGISVSERWLDFKNFFDDMGFPEEGLSIDRIDNDAGYSKENCRWATKHTQLRNTRRNIFIEHNGESLCAKDWAIKLGFSSQQVITWRLRKGWTVEEALTNWKK